MKNQGNFKEQRGGRAFCGQFPGKTGVYAEHAVGGISEHKSDCEKSTVVLDEERVRKFLRKK